MNQPQELVPFTFTTYDDKKKPVRTEIKDDGSIWFVAKDVCDILELGNPSMACEKLEVEEKLVSKLLIAGQNRDVLLVNESGLYTLMFRSYKPEAKRFRKWVTSEVIPAIRKTGKYDGSNPFGTRAMDKESDKGAMMNLDRCPIGTSKQYKMYRVKTAIATIEAPATATGEKFILKMLDELNIR